MAVINHVFNKTPRTPPANPESLVKAITAKRNLRVSLIGENKLRIDFGTSAAVVVNLVQGQPPAWLALVPKGEPIMQAHIFAPQLEAAVKRLRAIAKDGGAGIIRMEFVDGKLKLSAAGSDQHMSSVLDTLNAKGEPQKTAIDQKFILAYIAKKTGIFSMKKFTDNGPLVFEYQNSPRVLIMPMQAGEENSRVAAEEPKEDIVENVEETPEGVTETTDENEAEPSTEEEYCRGGNSGRTSYRLKPVPGNWLRQRRGC